MKKFKHKNKKRNKKNYVALGVFIYTTYLISKNENTKWKK